MNQRIDVAGEKTTIRCTYCGEEFTGEDGRKVIKEWNLHYLECAEKDKKKGGLV